MTKIQNADNHHQLLVKDGAIEIFHSLQVEMQSSTATLKGSWWFLQN